VTAIFQVNFILYSTIHVARFNNYKQTEQNASAKQQNQTNQQTPKNVGKNHTTK
jgi:hypothetical protein